MTRIPAPADGTANRLNVLSDYKRVHMISPKELWSLVKASVNAWLEDRAASMGAALAYYTAFSIAPLLIIAIAVAGLVFGRDAAQQAVVAQLEGLLGPAGGTAIEAMLKSTADFGSSILAMVIGVSALIIAATTAFVELSRGLRSTGSVCPFPCL